MADCVAESSTLLVVDEKPAPDDVARMLADSLERSAVETIDPDGLADAVGRPGENGGIDGVVLVGEVTVPVSCREWLATADVPVVAYADTEPTAAYVEGYVERGTDTDQLRTEIERAREGETRRQLRSARRKVTELHGAAAKIAAAESIDELFEQTISVADRVLSFDHCAIGVKEGETLVARERSTDWLPSRVPIEGTVAGLTLQREETVHISNFEEMEFENSEATGSSITVPVVEDIIFQAVSRRQNAFDEMDRELAELLATHVGQAVTRLRTQADLARRERVMAELHEAAPRLVDAENEDELFDLTVQIAERVLAFDRSCVYIVDGDDFRRRATTDDGLPTTIDRGFGAMAVSHEEGRSLVVDDVPSSDVAEALDGRSGSLVSVPFGDDAVFQAVTADTGRFDEGDLEFAELLVSYASVTRERIRSEAALREARMITEQLHDAATELAAADDEETLIDRAIQASENVLSFDKSTIALRQGDKLVPAADSTGSPPNSSRPMDLDEGIAGRTYQTGESVLIDEVADHDDAAPARSEYRSGLSVPIGDLGTFQAVSTEPEAFDRDDLNNAELLMAHAAVSLTRIRTEADLRAERDRLSALFENVPDAALSFELVDGAPVVQAINPAFEETFGYGEEVVGEYLDDYIVPDDDEQEASAYNERLANGESLRMECRRKTADGLRDFLMYVVPLELGSENLGGYAIYSDITERRERERRLRRQNERLDEFASVVSHDLRNPLSIAEGYLDLARETNDSEHLDTVADAIGRMRQLIDDLLQLAREGRVVGDTVRVDVASAARRAWGTVDTADATLDTDDDVVVDADPDRLREILENLFRNAVEHGGNARTVYVESTSDGFAVADDGPGVDPDDRDEVFEVGVTTAEEGTGFGLAIVRTIAEAHGWTVTLTESEDGGARFEFDTACA